MSKPTRHDVDTWFAELIADLNAIYNDYHETPGHMRFRINRVMRKLVNYQVWARVPGLMGAPRTERRISADWTNTASPIRREIDTWLAALRAELEAISSAVGQATQDETRSRLVELEKRIAGYRIRLWRDPE